MFFLRFVDENLDKILPEVDIDWTPVFTIPYQHLPQDLTIWEERDSWLLDPDTKENIHTEDQYYKLAPQSFQSNTVSPTDPNTTIKLDNIRTIQIIHDKM